MAGPSRDAVTGVASMCQAGAAALAGALALETPRSDGGWTLVAIDGVDGSGKTTFAAALERDVLAPFGPRGGGLYRSAATDRRLDLALDPPRLQARPGTVCIVEGMFLHRRELAGRWDYSVFLDVPFAETARRMAVRDGTPADPGHPGMRRYVGGQRLYFAEAAPWLRADRVVDNTDPAEPLVTPQAAGHQRGRHIRGIAGAAARLG
ncbi:uridine kinase [Arthrobacter sp. STN4]|uniref:uridine kinase n=1 Tax=Arthrobacter sp. STN4 TaxID=2923276 RepID=UPI00211A236D|nr:uridine kinase [Arthrobacter sp. STN4]MCQ9163324.1 uridine kinase [Arthrobacter sp. STN4]